MSKGKSLSFLTLFEEVDRVEIPIIQRDYAQGRELAKDVRVQFLSAIKEALITRQENKGASLELDFIYGYFEPGADQVFSVLDGQQRLTTLFLLHWYLAAKANSLPDFRKRWASSGRSRFTYCTRPSSTEFFDALVSNDCEIPAARGKKVISDYIVDSHWFFLSWQKDPTIQSCLTMLDEIHSLFSDDEDLYSLLIDANSEGITFQYLNLEDFGLSDDLYVKMNARGKPLTPFENFKAWLVGRIKDAPWAEEFDLKMDQEWLDFFWQMSQEKKQDYDELFLRFFYIMAFFAECEKIKGSFYFADADTRTWLARLRTERGYLSLRDLERHDSLNHETLGHTSLMLDYFCRSSNEAHLDLLEEVLQSAEFLSLAKFYSLVAFVIRCSRTEIHTAECLERLRCWERVTDNLNNNTRVDELATLVPAINNLQALSKHSAGIYDALAKMNANNVGYSRAQAEEEIIKAKLILEESSWEQALIRAEEHEYLRGRVGFLLRASETQPGAYSQSVFQEYADKASILLSRNVLRSTEFLLHRALLSLGDYFVWRGGEKYSFCQPTNTSFRERSENWLHVVEQPIFRKLLDCIDGDVIASLKKLISSASCNDWRQCFIACPEAFEYCKERLIHRSGSQVYLLSKSRLSGYYAELYTYSLYKLLEKRHQRKGAPDFIKYMSYGEDYGGNTPYISLTFSDDLTVTLWYSGGCILCGAGGAQIKVPEQLANYLSRDLRTFGLKLA